AGFGYNNFDNTGGVNSYNMYSTDPTAKLADSVQGNPYTVSQLPTSFIVAIDVNTASPNTPGETLTSFQVLDTTTNTVLYHFTGVAGSHNIGSPQNNGNGWADYTLSTVNLAGLPSTDHILFHAVWSDASDGGESFFIIPAAVPGPLAGAGLPGLIAACGGLLALARRRRQLVV